MSRSLRRSRIRSRVRARAVMALVAAGGGTVWAAPPRYRIVDLTEIAAPLGVVQCEARHVNEAGVIVGFEVLGDIARERAIYWDAALTPSLLPSLSGDNSTMAMGITSDGRAIGMSEKVTIIQTFPLLIWTEDQKAVIWEAGGPVRLADLVSGGAPIRMRQAWDINGSGQICGFGDVPGVPPATLEFKGFGLMNGAAGPVTDVSPIDYAVAINAFGTIVGSADNIAYRWDSGGVTDLNQHPSLRPNSTEAWGVSDPGVVVGSGQFNPGGAPEPTRWDGIVPTRLITEFVRPQGAATGIDHLGRIIGYYINLDNLNDVWHGFMQAGSTRYELLSLIEPAGHGFEQLFPFDINAGGVIVGGALRNGTFGHGFVMYPLCYADCNADGEATVGDFGCFQTRFVQGDAYADCNEDGQRTVADFGCFQTKFVQGCP